MIVSLLAGAACGILSGFGIGGGTLLLIYMTTWGGLEQSMAQGINLIYFLPTAGIAVYGHSRNGYLEKSVLLPAILTGLIAAAVTAWISTGLDTGFLHRCFGYFLMAVGISELFRREKPVTDPVDGSGDR